MKKSMQEDTVIVVKVLKTKIELVFSYAPEALQNNCTLISQ